MLHCEYHRGCRRFSRVRNSSRCRCCLKPWPQRNCRRCSRKDRFIRSTHQSTPPVPRCNWPNVLMGGRDSLMLELCAC